MQQGTGKVNSRPQGPGQEGAEGGPEQGGRVHWDGHYAGYERRET